MTVRLLALALFLLSAPLRAGENVWTPIGPEGGTVTDLAFAANGRTVYAGTPSGQVFKSINTGRTWSSTDSSLRGAVRELETDPAQSARVYAATSLGIWKSDDAGRSWRDLTRGLPGGRETADVLTVVTDPLSPGVVYLSVDGGPSGLPRVFRSADGGASWQLATAGLPGTVRAIAVHPRRRGVLFAATRLGVFRSGDSGRSWQRSGLRGSDVVEVEIDPLQPSRVYAVRMVALQGQLLFPRPEVLVSENDGGGWRPSQSTVRGVYNGRLAVDPLSPGTAYFFSEYSDVQKTTDAGRHWEPIRFPGPLPGDVFLSGSNALALNPRQPGMLLVGRRGDYDRAILRSTDGGESWSSSGSGFRALQAGQVIADPRTPGLLYVSTASGLWKTADAGRSWRLLNVPEDRIVLDPREPLTIYASGFRLYKSIDGGEEWRELFGAPPFATLTLAPTAPDTLYGGSSGRIYKSTDGGESWSGLSATAGFDTTILTVAPNHASTVYANVRSFYPESGDNLDSVRRSTDAGVTWTKLLELPAGLNFRDIAVHPDDSSRVLAAFSEDHGTVLPAGVYRTSDGGLTWQVSHLSGENPTAFSLLFDPQRSSRVYAGSLGQVFVSEDAGGTWTPLGPGLPHHGVGDLEADPFDPETIYAATEGGLYSLTYHPGR